MWQPNPYHDWVLLGYWARCPNWLRIATALPIIALGAFFFTGVKVIGGMIGVIGLLMLAHGVFAKPEEGPGPD